MNKYVHVIGGGLSGCEAALQLSEMGWKVSLYEMRPIVQTPAHQSDSLAELVCSNSLKSFRHDTGAGLLKAELELLGCRLLEIAKEHCVPAGQALAVDRELFANAVQERILKDDNIRLIREEITEIPDGTCIVASGPLTSDRLMANLAQLLGDNQLFFFDAIAPIIDADSIDFTKVYAKTRYDKGEADYLNCAFSKDEYLDFVQALLEGEKHEAREFENEFFKELNFSFYENCIPIEELAKRGIDTLRHGVMRPMGLEAPGSDDKPFAVIQLRAENKDKTAYNLVGCQTMLRYPEQRRIFRLIPGLENADFLRFGSIHRNSYLNAPMIFNPDLSLKANHEVFIAGQLAGVEGYMESIATGLLVAQIISGKLKELPQETILGQIWRRLTETPQKGRFSPVNANFGILPAGDTRMRDKKQKRLLLAERSLDCLRAQLGQII